MSPEGQSSRIGFNEAMTNPPMTWKERGLMVNSLVAGFYAGMGAEAAEVVYRLATHHNVDIESSLAKGSVAALTLPVVAMAGMVSKIAYGRGWLHPRESSQVTA